CTVSGKVALPGKWVDALPQRYTTRKEKNNGTKSTAKQRLQFYFKKEANRQRRNFQEKKLKNQLAKHLSERV
ncbi:7568_t:CDS:2, partial [Ambispora gerdemannii]